jgi:prepilin-type N-terminal cleavage/methylation domain-containing protein
MLKKLDKRGFTIIEVLIVLAIAGLILLVVFLAVPALQRNSRNTQAKQAAAAILSSVNEYSANNNGTMPAYVAVAANGDISVGPAAATAVVTGKTQGGFTASVSTTAPTSGTTGAFAVATNRKCNGAVLATGTQNRAVAILYNVETSSGTSPQCTES